MRILIATGIFPPQIGGPAQYAKELAKAFERTGHEVCVKTYRLEHVLPTGIRHLLFFFRILVAMRGVDFVVALDTFSVGMPAVFASRLLHKKIIIRTGGDFLWESYVERTKDLVLFREFYDETAEKWNRKELIIFSLTRTILQKADAVIFSTKWQRDIFTQAYSLSPSNCYIVENFYGPKELSQRATGKNFIAGTRQLAWKNHSILRQAFAQAVNHDSSLRLDEDTVPHDLFLEKMKSAYAVILVSIGDISPNMILEAIRFGKPFIVTREIGMYDRIKDIGLFVDPKNPEDIKEKILQLADPAVYETYRKKVELYTFTHTWDEIAQEFLAIAQKL